MVCKSNVFKIFVKFYAFIVNHFNASIRCFWPSQQNGLAKMKHKHLVEKILSLMSEAHLFQMFCTHATFFINRMPCKSLGMRSISGYILSKSLCS